MNENYAVFHASFTVYETDSVKKAGMGDLNIEVNEVIATKADVDRLRNECHCKIIEAEPIYDGKFIHITSFTRLI